MVKGKTGSRSKNIEINKRLIMDAAKAVILKNGVDKITIRGLAKDAGIDPRTIYNLFGSKERVITELLKNEAKIFAPIILGGLTKSDPLNFHNIVDSVYALAKGDEGLFMALISTAISQGPPRFTEGLAALMEPMFVRYVEQGFLVPEANAKVLSHAHMHDVMSKTALWARDEVSMTLLANYLKHDYALLLYKSATSETREHLHAVIGQIETDIEKLL